MEKQFGEYWNITPGQIKDHKCVDSGYRTKEKAVAGARDLVVSFLIGLFDTIESNLPFDDPACEKFSSMRWCIIIDK